MLQAESLQKLTCFRVNHILSSDTFNRIYKEEGLCTLLGYLMGEGGYAVA
jgi:hypothetical protein